MLNNEDKMAKKRFEIICSHNYRLFDTEKYAHLGNRSFTSS